MVKPTAAPNTAVHYLYRDSANNKQHAYFVLPGQITPEERAALGAHLIGARYFKPELVDLEDLRGRWGNAYEDAPDVHELLWEEIGHTANFATSADEDVHAFVARLCATAWVHEETR